ncbi:hypothetical protein [Micromonospora sp. NPDC047074]|uniref:hypothetical protein n=1 Tax=Micromonospora sp. NPDC047074 TaxID=3154339 RepID=UPI0033CA6F84
MRILVVGCPGAGKSTFAASLARATGLPLRHLDDEYWGAGWSRPDQQWWLEHQTRLTGGEHWIIDGNYLPTMQLRVPRADLVVLVDAATSTCLVRVLRRAWRIRRGDPAALPERVRAQAESGTPVPATKAFLPLLAMILRFRRRDWWRVVDVATAQPGTTLLAAVVGGPLGTRLAGVRRRLSGRAPSATVCPLPTAAQVIRELIGDDGATSGRAADAQVHELQGGNRP